MRFHIARRMTISEQALTEGGEANMLAVATTNSLKEVEEMSRLWHDVGAILLSKSTVTYFSMLEEQDGKRVQVKQHLSIDFFDLLHAVRQGKVKISERKYDKQDDYWYRTADLVSELN